MMGKPAIFKNKKGEVILPFTNNLPLDLEPISGSSNFLDSNSIYDALSYKSNIDHTHTEIKNNITFDNRVNIGSVLTVSGVTYLNSVIRHEIPSGSSDLVYLMDYDMSVPASTLIQPSGTVARTIFFLGDDEFLPKRHTILQMTRSVSYSSSSNLESYYTSLTFGAPQTGAANLPSSNLVISCYWRTGYERPWLNCSTPTQGYAAELTRVDWVKQRIRDYAFPNWSTSTNIKSAWTAEGWLNNLGNGYLILGVDCAKTSATYRNITLWSCTSSAATSGTRMATWGNMNEGRTSCSIPIPVLSGEYYALRGMNLTSSGSESSAASNTVALSGTNVVNIIPNLVFFVPVKY